LSETEDVPGMPLAIGDPNQLELAILNLCVNARDAMPDGGVLTITLEAIPIGPQSTPSLAPGLYVRLSVIDTAHGMDAATLARAVDPFFSTKEVGRGTGLGLSMVHGLAGQLGGTLTLSSHPGEGTRVDLWLPSAAARSASAERKDVPGRAIPEVPSQSMLLVDDEDIVPEATAEMLRELGHFVVTATGGEDALFKLSGLSVDLVITDYMMPRMHGAELATRIREMQLAYLSSSLPDIQAATRSLRISLD
jgi:CheY-like chemotaxis protein